jgi:CubicO group peptidase (beta-lactamase class C family)
MRIIYYLIPFLFFNLSCHCLEQEDLEIESRINQRVEAIMHKGKIPGLSLVVIKDGKIFIEKGYGYANLEKGTSVTPETLFEIGSTTKAFTALAILKLAKENQIDLQAPISAYLSWFYCHYQGHRVPITVQDCLYHTSGIPFQTIARIPISTSDQAIEETVKRIQGVELLFLPSQQFHYATINFDILGLLIQTISGQSYESYIEQHILKPLGLAHSTFDRQTAYLHPLMATGYKIEFLNPRPFLAPPYRGNTPAGYLISNIRDISHWLLHQIDFSSALGDIIMQSHKPNRSLFAFGENIFYGAGWLVFNTDHGDIFAHTGNNPNFSSYFSILPEKKIGVGILANVNSAYTLGLGQAITALFLEQEGELPHYDIFQIMDIVSVGIICSCLFLLLISVYYWTKAISEINRGMRKLRMEKRSMIVLCAAMMIGLISLIFIQLPGLIFLESHWEFIKVWAPASLVIALNMIYVSLISFVLYIAMVRLFKKPKGHES